jgi:hypothetical protein
MSVIFDTYATFSLLFLTFRFVVKKLRITFVSLIYCNQNKN